LFSINSKAKVAEFPQLGLYKGNAHQTLTEEFILYYKMISILKQIMIIQLKVD
jgi:hypothetical protein